MKNLRDNELFDELGSRLRNYSEDPDEEAWNKIFEATQSAPEPKWISRTLYASVAASIVAFLLLIYPTSSVEERHETESNTNQKIVKKKPTERNLSSITNETEVVSENKKYSLKVSETESSGSLIQKNGEENRSAKNTEEAQYIVESVISDDFRKEIQMVKELHPEKLVNSDTTKELKTIRTDSVKIKDKKPIEDRKKKIRRGFDFYASVTPLLSYQKITPLQNDNITVDKFSSSPVMSGDRFGISFEAGVQGKVSKHLEYYGGLSYYQQNQTLSYRYKSGEGSTVASDNDPLHFTVTPGEHNRQVSYTMKNVGAQLGILYYLKGETLKHKVGAGLSYQQGLQKISAGDTYDNSKSSYLFYQLFYRTEFQVNESMCIFFQPNFSQAILSNEELSAPFKLKPYRAGLSFGIICHF